MADAAAAVAALQPVSLDVREEVQVGRRVKSSVDRKGLGAVVGVGRQQRAVGVGATRR